MLNQFELKLNVWKNITEILLNFWYLSLNAEAEIKKNFQNTSEM